jgi:methionine aminopeptidase type I
MLRLISNCVGVIQPQIYILKRNDNSFSLKRSKFQHQSSLSVIKTNVFVSTQFGLFQYRQTLSRDNRPMNLVNFVSLKTCTESAITTSTLPIPKHIQLPLYLTTGEQPTLDASDPYSKATIHTQEDIAGIRESCKLAAKVLYFAASLVAPNITTNEIDQRVHDYIIAHGAYPSPLLYRGFPKSICTSVNEIASHGVPDYRLLQEGDIINIDITVYYNGYHGDCAATFPVGKISSEAKRLIEVARKCTEVGIAQCGPQKRFCDIGNSIAAYAQQNGFNVIPNVAGHGIGRHFHDYPIIFHCRDIFDQKTPTKA